MSDVILIGCSQLKALQMVDGNVQPRLPAKALYVSPLFVKRRAYAERSGKPWAILSALYGLVMPDREIQTYDFKISDRRKDELDFWGSQAVTGFEGLEWLVGGCDYATQRGALAGKSIEIHAGAAYIDPLEPYIVAKGGTVLRPLAGLGIGEQLHWYRAEIDPQLVLPLAS